MGALRTRTFTPAGIVSVAQSIKIEIVAMKKRLGEEIGKINVATCHVC